ncbi:MAG: DUF805 domain-containing protein [Pseudomonadota bacterium]
MRDEYSPPAAPVADQLDYGDVKIFSPQGRFGRIRYLAHSFWVSSLIYAVGVLIVVSLGLAADEVTEGTASAIIMIPLIVVTFIFTIKRCHDFNASGWWSVLVLIPLVNLLFVFIPGNAGANRFGKKPPPNTLLLWLGGLALPLTFMAGVLAAIALPAYQDYTARAQVGESMNVSTPVRQTMAAFAQDNGWPTEADLEELGLSEPVDSVYAILYAHADTGVVEIVMKGAPPNAQSVANGTILLTPYIEERVLRYRCASDDIEPRFLPKSCQ